MKPDIPEVNLSQTVVESKTDFTSSAYPTGAPEFIPGFSAMYVTRFLSSVL
jgi:hypothetical protein